MSDAAPPPVSGSLLTKKLGPLPTWGWMGIGLGGVLVWRLVAGKKSAGADAAAGPVTPTSGYKLPSNIPPQFTQVNEDSYSTSINSGNVVNNAAAPVPAPLPPDGKYVTIGRHDHGLGRVAKDAWGSATLWRAIWNDPKNASLKAVRESPRRLQTGDQVWVPTAAPTGVATGQDIGHGDHGPNGGEHDWNGGDRYGWGGSRHTSDRDHDRSGHGHDRH